MRSCETEEHTIDTCVALKAILIADGPVLKNQEMEIQ